MIANSRAAPVRATPHGLRPTCLAAPSPHELSGSALDFAQQLADQAGFTPASYPLNYADYTPPSTLDALLTELGLSGFADSGASTASTPAASVPDLLAEFAALGML